ncbi:MAG: helix-turn-helix transcriptional regulator [Eggerthellaceae bacterium]|nr:helix-turn-helix transcriptional regulator [Eggerthellaceae bacterium]
MSAITDFMLPEDWSIEPISDCVWRVWHAREDGRLDLTCYELAHGILLMDIDLNCRTLPVASSAMTSDFTLNWCSQGRCEVDLGQSGSAVLEAGHLCASMTRAQSFAYPTVPYRGFEYHINFDRIDRQTRALLHGFDIDLPHVGEKLCSNTPAFIAKPEGALLRTVEIILELMVQELPKINHLLVATCQLFALLAEVNPSAQRVASAYLQHSQRDLARRLRVAIEADPAGSGYANALARETGVGEASLRGYFSRMYGTAPATYARELVLTRAAEMLATETASVSDVALTCNYSNPSKFAAAFKRQFGINPTEYRRRKALERLEETVHKQEIVGKRKYDRNG